MDYRYNKYSSKFNLPSIVHGSRMTGILEAPQLNYVNNIPNSLPMISNGIYPMPYSSLYWPYYGIYGQSSLYPYNLYGDFYYPCLRCKNCSAHPHSYCFHQRHKI